MVNQLLLFYLSRGSNEFALRRSNGAISGSTRIPVLDFSLSHSNDTNKAPVFHEKQLQTGR
jgi:hypothetical protein